MTNTVIRKPWGREYRCYRNAALAIWALHMREGRATSLHCHPGKNTAFVLLRGALDLELLRGPRLSFKALDKINVFRGRFHRLRAITDVILLEVEAPDDKRDIVRLEDDHGRAGDQLEQPSEPLSTSDLLISGHAAGGFFADCWWSILRPESTEELVQVATGDAILVTLSGGLERGLLPSGDAIDGASMARLASAFGVVAGSSFLRISKETP